jgi:hypothetical protein
MPKDEAKAKVAMADAAKARVLKEYKKAEVTVVASSL